MFLNLSNWNEIGVSREGMYREIVSLLKLKSFKSHWYKINSFEFCFLIFDLSEYYVLSLLII